MKATRLISIILAVALMLGVTSVLALAEDTAAPALIPIEEITAFLQQINDLYAYLNEVIANVMGMVNQLMAGFSTIAPVA